MLCLSSFQTYGEHVETAAQTYAKSSRFDANGSIIYLEFQDQLNYSPEQVVRLWHQIYGLNSDYSFVKGTDLHDVLGMEHIRYQMLHKGIPVDGSELILHIMDRRVVSFNGHVYPVRTQETRITPEQAIQKALEHYPSNAYKWQSAHEEEHLKEMEDDPDATYYPNPELVYVPVDFRFDSANFVLAYKMDVYSEAPLFRKWVYVSAIDGSEVAYEDRICHANSNGTAFTRYSGTQGITTDSVNATTYRLRETARGNGIETYNMQNGNKYGSAVDFTDNDNAWNNINAKQDEIATDAHWGAERTYDYFWNLHGRNSFDNNGAKIRSYVHYGNKYNNAFWNGSVMTYGDGDSTRFYPLTSIDVCGHEIAHAVTTNSANLVYRYESGALNESFSDIFGNAIEAFAKPTKFDWAIGEDITPNGTGIRNMKTPNSKRHPDSYKGTYWRTGTADNGGVHSNSGVQNHWFYLLCHGGVGTNDKSEIYRVDSIGMAKAEKIAYRNLSVYLTRSSQYADARLFAIQAAQDLYGYCSQELIATTNAWHAVSVGEKYDSMELSIGFTGDTMFCHPPAVAHFTNLSVNAKNYTWHFGDGGTSNVANPNHTYLQYGTFDVKLVGEGCFNGYKDSFERKTWVVVDSNFDICNSYIMPLRSWDSVYDCKGMIYDNGGEDMYTTAVRDTFTVNTGPSDSILIEFLDFDYERNYDYVYIYAGNSPAAPLVGRYTGQNLPNGGAPIVVNTDVFTIQHFSDPLVVGRGFKLKYEAIRPALTLNMPNDTSICQGSGIWIKPMFGGGHSPDYAFDWSTGDRADSIFFTTDTDSTVYLRFYDSCTDREILDSIRVTVLPALSLTLMPDSLVCQNQNINLTATATGGLSSSWQVNWSHGPSGFSVPFSTPTDSTVTAILTDNCSSENDTAQIKITVRDALGATLTKDTIICVGQSVDLSAIGNGGKAPHLYFWDNGLGAGANKTVTPAVPTTYNVTVSDGCTSPTFTGSIRVHVRDYLRLNMSPDTTICAGNLVHLRAIPTGGDTVNYSYQWTHGLADAAAHSIKPIQSGTYKVILNDNCSPAPLEDSIVVTVLDTLSISITGKDTVCYGENILLQANATGGMSATYVINWDNGLGSGARVNANPLTDVTYMAVLSDGCTVKNDTAYKKVVVRDPLEVTVTPDQADICDGDTVTLIATGTGGLPGQYQFLWDNGLGNNSVVKVSPRFDTRYTVVLTDNCSNFVDTSVSVNIMPTPNINFEIYPNPQCVGQTVTFKNNTVDKENLDLLWSFGDGVTTKELDPTHEYSSPGIYTVGLRATNSFGCTDSFVMYNGMQIELAPEANFTYSPLEVTLLDPTVTFTNNSKNATQWNWTFGDGGASTDFEPTHVYSDSGHYQVTLIAQNDVGCQSPQTIIVHVKDIFRMYVPSAFTPGDRDDLNQELSITANGIKEFEIKIFNRWGELVYSSTDYTKTWSGRDSSGELNPIGVYFYTVRVIDVNREKHDLKGTINLLR